MKPITVPEQYNYIAVFLTLSCNLSCSYCINRFDSLRSMRGQLSGKEWIEGLNRIVSRPDLPLTLGGGEPSLHPDFTEIINGIRPELNIDLLTNLEFDIDRFIEQVNADRIKRTAPYASIRVSYHPELMQLETLMKKVLRLQAAGYSIGVWGVLHPEQEASVLQARALCGEAGIDFRTKEFLGEHDGMLHGKFRYAGACSRKSVRQVQCRTSELLIGPAGDIYRCHSDLYAGRAAIGHILDPDFFVDDSYRPCSVFGYCNPCDVKIKTDRFQKFGHTAVDIVANDPECGDLAVEQSNSAKMTANGLG